MLTLQYNCIWSQRKKMHFYHYLQFYPHGCGFMIEFETFHTCRSLIHWWSFEKVNLFLFPGGRDLTRAQNEGIQQTSSQCRSPTIGRHIQGILTTSKKEESFCWPDFSILHVKITVIGKTSSFYLKIHILWPSSQNSNDYH